ncbi:MAG: hypothetical protein GF383_12975 [Candidatus Lokiarchaeota archaeon]|nr:hypothetical protein [Candidatus Lokiarchaeota archaeon]MBD3342020.1 hypothetical protein [Candidatus Lokiarchaeota archaeon]
MEKFDKKEFNMSTLMKIHYKPEFANLFNNIKDINTPVKNNILMALLDGEWHSERELIRIAKKQQEYVGVVTLGMMVRSLNGIIKSDYVKKKVINNQLCYKISDNYIGLTRAAFTKFRYLDV